MRRWESSSRARLHVLFAASFAAILIGPVVPSRHGEGEARAQASPDSAAPQLDLPDSAALRFDLPDSVAMRRSGWREARILGDDSIGPFPLGAAFIFAGSESVTVGGALLRPSVDYTIDANRGSILFTRAVAAGDSVRVAFRFLPFAIAPSYGRWTPRPLGTPAESVAVLESAPDYGPSLFETGGLRVGGSKSISLLAGSDRDITLDQALRISIEGALSEEVSVTARLSDENLAFTPEGSSARLEDLDKVFVEIASPHLGATLGDYEVNLAGGEFATYRRVLKGALGRADYGPFLGSASAGVSEGRLLSVELRGVEGLQGPYSIVDVGAQTVVAGSEEVFLDGLRLIRGEDNDYVIDYAVGEIRFTSKRPIRTGTRIAVDFQVTGDEFKRNYVTAATRASLAGRESEGPIGGEGAVASGGGGGAARGATGVTTPGSGAFGGPAIGITFLSESDDEDDPQGILLSVADRDSLAAAGDADALVSGATLDTLRGDYNLVEDRFVYAGRDSGDYTVIFSFLGGGRGRYNPDLDPITGDRIFAFDAVDSSGDYDPVRQLPRPISQNIISLDARGSPLPGLVLAMEGAHSEIDENTLSDLDDEDNGGEAITARGGWTSGEIRPAGARLGSINVSGRVRRLGEGFAALTRLQDVHFDQRWNTQGFERVFTPDSIEGNRLSTSEEGGLAQREDIAEGEINYRPVEGLVAGIEAGAFSQKGLVSSDRGVARAEYASPGHGRATARAERIRSEGASGPGRTERLSASLARTFGRWSPGLAASREDRRAGLPDSISGSRRDRGSLSLGVTAHRALHLGAELVLEESALLDSLTGARVDWFRANEQELSATLSPGSSYSVSSRYHRRRIDYTSLVSDPDETNHLGRLEVRHRSFDAGLTGEYDYDVSTLEANRRKRVLVELPENEVGDFDSLGNFVPGQGRYRVADIELTGVPTTDLSASARLVLEPSRWMARDEERGGEPGGEGAPSSPSGAEAGGAWAGFLRGLRLQGLASVTERSTTSEKLALLFFDPDEMQDDSTTIRGEIVTRLEGTWRSPSGAIVSGRHGRTDIEDNSVENANREELRHESLVRARGSVSRRVTAEAEWEPRRTRIRLNGTETALVHSDFLGSTGTYQPNPNLSASLMGRFGWEREMLLSETIHSFEVAASTIATVLEKGRVTARLATLQFLREERSGSLASPLTARAEGEEWRLSADYDFSRYLTGSLLYSGDNRQTNGVTHLFKMEARALF